MSLAFGSGIVNGLRPISLARPALARLAESDFVLGLPHRGSVLAAFQAGAGCAGARGQPGERLRALRWAGYELASKRELEKEHSWHFKSQSSASN